MVDNTQAMRKPSGSPPGRRPLRGRASARAQPRPECGHRAATGELIAFLDDDAVVDPAWLRRTPRRLRTISHGHNRQGRAGCGPECGETALDLGEQPFVVDRNDPWWFERANFGGLGSGANMVFKRRLSTGLRFRETLGLGADLEGFEDYYFCGSSDRARRPDRLRAGCGRHSMARALSRADVAVARLDHRRGRRLPDDALVEEPGFRARTMRYIAQVLRGRNGFPGVRAPTEPPQGAGGWVSWTTRSTSAADADKATDPGSRPWAVQDLHLASFEAQ